MAIGGDLVASRVLRLQMEADIPANTELSIPPYNDVNGFRFINLVVKYIHEDPNEPPVDLGVEFAFDEKGLMSTRRYVNLEENLPAPQTVRHIQIEGPASAGTPNAVVTYVARIPIMGPFIEVFPKNRASVNRKVTVWGYLIA